MKNFLKAVIVIISMGLIIVLCEKVLLLKSEDGIEQIEAYYLQKDNTVDVLFLGSSHIYCDLNTGTLWKEYGIASFDLGGAEQPYWNSYYYLKEALKTQTPKVIVMDITTPGIRATDFQPENWVICNNYGMHWNKNRIDALKVSTLEQSFTRLLFPLNTIHNRYDELTKDDFVDVNQRSSYKGFDPRETITGFETPDISNVTEMEPVSEKAEKYLRKIIELTKEKDIPLLMVSAPYVVTEDSQKLYNYIFAIAEENEIPYMDFNKKYEELGMDFQTDMAEDLHLNEYGNEKYSKYLGRYLQETYTIPDRRGDNLYVSWEVDAQNQLQEKEKVFLFNAETIDDYLTQLQNKNYVIYISLADGIEEAEKLQAVKEKLSRLGIAESDILNKQTLIVNNGTKLYSSNKDEFKAFIEIEKDRLLLIREKNEYDECTTSLFLNDERANMRNTGMDIMVYDKQLKQLIDHVNFDFQNDFTKTR